MQHIPTYDKNEHSACISHLHSGWSPLLWWQKIIMEMLRNREHCHQTSNWCRWQQAFWRRRAQMQLHKAPRLAMKNSNINSMKMFFEYWWWLLWGRLFVDDGSKRLWWKSAQKRQKCSGDSFFQPLHDLNKSNKHFLIIAKKRYKF